MQIILLFLCIFAGFLIFLPQTPVPVVYHRPLLALFFLVCSLVTAVRTYRQGIAKKLRLFEGTCRPDTDHDSGDHPIWPTVSLNKTFGQSHV